MEGAGQKIGLKKARPPGEILDFRRRAGREVIRPRGRYVELLGAFVSFRASPRHERESESSKIMSDVPARRIIGPRYSLPGLGSGNLSGLPFGYFPLLNSLIKPHEEEGSERNHGS